MESSAPPPPPPLEHAPPLEPSPAAQMKDEEQSVKGLEDDDEIKIDGQVIIRVGEPPNAIDVVVDAFVASLFSSTIKNQLVTSQGENRIIKIPTDIHGAVMLPMYFEKFKTFVEHVNDHPNDNKEIPQPLPSRVLTEHVGEFRANLYKDWTFADLFHCQIGMDFIDCPSLVELLGAIVAVRIASKTPDEVIRELGISPPTKEECEEAAKELEKLIKQEVAASEVSAV